MIMIVCKYRFDCYIRWNVILYKDVTQHTYLQINYELTKLISKKDKTFLEYTGEFGGNSTYHYDLLII